MCHSGRRPCFLVWVRSIKTWSPSLNRAHSHTSHGTQDGPFGPVSDELCSLQEDGLKQQPIDAFRPDIFWEPSGCRDFMTSFLAALWSPLPWGIPKSSPLHYGRILQYIMIFNRGLDREALYITGSPTTKRTTHGHRSDIVPH